MKTALITGINGQDGIHLAEYLLKKNYEVYGMVNGQKEDSGGTIAIKFPDVKRISGDLADAASLISVLQKVQPDEIYNLGAISFVALSFSQPELTANITGLGPLRILEAIRLLGLKDKTKLYQASSSEMFGKVRETPQKETTPFHPRSPYAAAKAFAHQISINYREAYEMFVSCGILFNHEGPYRGHEFVTRKITQSVARIKLGIQDELRLGNLESRRDWGYAGDFVKAMYLMLRQEKPEDFVIATGETHSVREFVEAAFAYAGITDGIEKYVKIDSRFIRPSEVDLLIGDATKAKDILGWKPEIKFDDLVAIMMENDLRIESALR
jgi:GDPmannose 4,6-dehydratase